MIETNCDYDRQLCTENLACCSSLCFFQDSTIKTLFCSQDNIPFVVPVANSPTSSHCRKVNHIKLKEKIVQWKVTARAPKHLQADKYSRRNNKQMLGRYKLTLIPRTCYLFLTRSGNENDGWRAHTLCTVVPSVAVRCLSEEISEKCSYDRAPINADGYA